jgi:hypothetical protein
MAYQPERPDTRWAAILAGCTLAFVVAVIAASAHVRLGSDPTRAASAASIEAARDVRKGAGAIAAAGVMALAVAAPVVGATRAALGVAAVSALAMTVVLSLVGLATGIGPPPWAAYTNQFGGALLAGVLGWLLGRASGPLGPVAQSRRLARAALFFGVLQAAFGGALATLLRDPPVLILVLHAATGLAAMCFALAFAAALGQISGRSEGTLIAACAAGVPLIGLACTLAPSSTALQVAHSLGGAILLACMSYALGRLAREA